MSRRLTIARRGDHLAHATPRSHRILAETGSILDAARLRYVLMGGLASAQLGRPRATEDIDLLVTPADASPALGALAEAGFETEETNPYWIFKARKHGVVVDLIFGMKGGIYLDEEMLCRSRDLEIDGTRVPVAAPEDVLVAKAIAHDEPSGHHWHDALGIVAAGELDWAYVLLRAQHGARRVLSLLVYAQSNDMLVPDWVVTQLFSLIYEPERRTDGSGSR
jgi:predicted nucleotidyltransferase